VRDVHERKKYEYMPVEKDKDWAIKHDRKFFPNQEQT
jgi:hypothetical protein